MAVRYVRATGGSDSNAGDTFVNGWATLAYAFNAGNANRIAAGDTLAVCGDTGSNVFTLTASLSPAFAAAPTYAAPVYFLGYDASGNPLTNGSFVKITTASALGNGLLNPTSTTTCAYMKFSNIYFDGGGSGKANYTVYTTTDNYTGFVFDNCRFTNSSSYGINARMTLGVGTAWRFFQCEIDNNGKAGTSGGFYSSSTASGAVYMRGCKIHDNNGPGVQFGDCGFFINNLVYKNTGDGIKSTQAGSSSIGSAFEQNVFFGNTGDGLDLNASTFHISIVNNIFRSNGGYGIQANSMDIDRMNTALVTNNCSHNNTSGHISINGGVLPGLGNVTSDPLFTSESAGSENFTLQSTSPCINSGYNPLGY
jgi:hypothetical protein